MEEIVFKRKIYDKLVEWKNKGGITSLLIEGARRVGKSTVALEFAQKEYKSFIYIDFNKKENEDVKSIFENNSADLNEFFEMIKARFGVELYERNSLIIFDEIQKYPAARELTKYLVEDGRYDYLLTGSLIRIKKNIQDITIPSEEEKIKMFPLDFEELLWACGDNQTIPYLKKCFDERKPVGVLHSKMMKRFRTYLLVGGMPQSVCEYVKTKEFGKCDERKKNILNLYEDDIYKFGDGNEAKALAIYNNIPGILSSGSKKFLFSSISENTRYDDLFGAINLLKESMIVNLCYRVNDPNIALALTKDESSFKCYSSDTGLLITQSFRNKNYLDNEVYKAILFDKFNVNEGMIVENYVAQVLRCLGYDLYYYSSIDKNNFENNIEIDFIIIQDNKLNPIEVKSGNYNKHTSIDRFKEKYKNKVGIRYVIHTKDLKVENDIIYLPLYMTQFL